MVGFSVTTLSSSFNYSFLPVNFITKTNSTKVLQVVNEMWFPLIKQRKVKLDVAFRTKTSCNYKYSEQKWFKKGDYYGLSCINLKNAENIFRYGHKYKFK